MALLLVVVECIDGEYYSSFVLGAEEEIKEAYASNQAFSLYSYDGCLIMHTDSEVIKNDNHIALNADGLDYPETRMTGIYEIAELLVADAGELSLGASAGLLSASAGAYTVTDIYVPYVRNGTSPNGGGMCWAACVASISNYRIGTNYTAASLYDRVWGVINGRDTEHYPTGDPSWIGYAFAINNMEYSYEENALTGIRVSNILSADRPIYMSLVRTDSNGENHYHAVVLQGIYIGARSFYLLMDPNDDTNNQTGYVVMVSVNEDVLNNGSHFVYTTGTRTYDNWRRSFY